MATVKEDQLPARVSVVIPVFNGGPDIEKCLAAISASGHPVSECILVDDASTDGMAVPAARRHGARVLRMDQQCGPAVARNHGVEEAVGDIIFFTDADVLLHPDAIGRAVDALQSDPEISAVIGSYDDQPGDPSFISQYRNLFHHWVHQTGDEEASTFWTGCGAVRRDVFTELGGFSQDFPKPSIEDIEFGTRLRRAGYRIRLLKGMLGQHLKQWRFLDTIRTDVFQRAIPWMALVLQDGQVTNDLNLSYKSRIATLLAGMLGLIVILFAVTGHVAALLVPAAFLLGCAICAAASVPANRHRGARFVAIALTIGFPFVVYWQIPDAWTLVPLAAVLAIAATHLAFYRYVARKRNLAFAFGVIPMQVVFFIGCAVSIPLAFAGHRTSR